MIGLQSIMQGLGGSLLRGRRSDPLTESAPPIPKLGVPGIDDDHRIVVEAFNAVIRIAGTQPQRLAVAIDQLSDLAAHHFQREESLMSLGGFAGAAPHIWEHAQFLATLAAYRERLSEGGEVAPGYLARFLWEWLDAHAETDWCLHVLAERAELQGALPPADLLRPLRAITRLLGEPASN